MSVAGVVLMIVGMAMVSGVLGRNPFVGVRTRTSLRDDASWVAIQRISGASTIVAGALWIVAGLLDGSVRTGLFVAGVVIEVFGPWVAVIQRGRQPRLPD